MSKSTITGASVIGFGRSSATKSPMTAFNPATRKLLPGEFYPASSEDIELALQLAESAFAQTRATSGSQRAQFLRKIGEHIMALGDTLIQRAKAESGLPEGRIKGERRRTVNQLNMFADIAEEGIWREVSIDLAQPDRMHGAKPDLRKMLRPLGPVVVFTASNFPLAFSTAGGDTASALASGCPVIVKAHESHLGTNELVAMAIQQAAKACGMPDGTFSSLNGKGTAIGKTLVSHPKVVAVAFTGSQRGGLALYHLAKDRPVPIPLFAEMGSINPMVVLPSSIKNEIDLAQTIASSVNMGAGQFCTSPGLVIVQESEGFDQFKSMLVDAFKELPVQFMLNSSIHTSYKKGVNQLTRGHGVEVLARSENEFNDEEWKARPIVSQVGADDFIGQPVLSNEVFGPNCLLVVCQDILEVYHVIASLEGQLTLTFHASESELKQHQELILLAAEKAGRVLFGGVPTGVEVCHSMQHGGPWPASTDSRFTSVGADAIRRFARPVVFQNFPQGLLPEELRDDSDTPRVKTVDGKIQFDK